MRIIVDGILYDHYPDEREQIAALRAEVKAWKAIAMENARAASRKVLR